MLLVYSRSSVEIKEKGYNPSYIMQIFVNNNNYAQLIYDRMLEFVSFCMFTELVLRCYSFDYIRGNASEKHGFI